jgi:hypothetical protein
LGDVWRPVQGTSWQWQLTGAVNLDVRADVYDIDLFDTDRSTVAALHAQGRRAICYMNAGAWEPGRPDSGQYPAGVLGNTVSGWPAERWLDVGNLAVLRPLIGGRLDLCRAKGFDAVEFDNVDGYQNNSGFPISAQDQLNFNRTLANEAHARGLGAALKNDGDQAAALVGSFDFAINEQCFEYSECNQLAPFTAAGKAVLHVEYNLDPSQFCSQARSLAFSSMRKNLNLDSWRSPC